MPRGEVSPSLFLWMIADCGLKIEKRKGNLNSSAPLPLCACGVFSYPLDVDIHHSGWKPRCPLRCLFQTSRQCRASEVPGLAPLAAEAQDVLRTLHEGATRRARSWTCLPMLSAGRGSAIQMILLNSSQRAVGSGFATSESMNIPPTTIKEEL